MNDKERIRAKIAEILGHAPAQIADDAILTDLVNNSFLLVETVIELQEEFNVRFQQADISDVVTVGQLLDLVVSRLPVATES